MSSGKRRGPGPSSLLLTPGRAGNVVAVDPHKRTLTASVLDARGGLLAIEHFRVSGDGHRALRRGRGGSGRSRGGGSRAPPRTGGIRRSI